MARRKHRSAVGAAKTLENGDIEGDADIELHDAPTEPPPPGGQEQAKQNGNPKKRKSPERDVPQLETTVINGVTYNVQPEGLAKILLPDQSKEQNTEVFYNYIQQFNRDLTMTVTRGFGEILEKERKAPKRKHRGGVKHKNRKGKPTNGENIANEDDEVVEGDDEGVDIQVDPAGDVGMADTAAGQLQSEEPPTPKPRFAVLDALSATGLRALRYAKELPFVTHITANDMSYSAVESISRNIEFNGVSHLVRPSLDNAIGHMYRTAYPAYVPAPTTENPNRMKPSQALKYHVIDLDPYGTAAPFIDSALQALEDGGLLSVTCTDAAIFASTSYPEKTFALYGGLPAKGDFSHEAGLRMVLMSIATTAGKYGLHIEPLLSLSIDYYCRVFIRVRRSPENVKRLASKSMVVVNCDSGCGSWKVQELGTMKQRVGKDPSNPNYKYGVAQATDSGHCEFCGFKMHLAGPMWSDPIHSASFINHLLSNVLNNETVKAYGTLGRITGMLKIALGELMPPSTPDSTEVLPTPAATPVPGQAPPTEPAEKLLPGKYFPTTKRKERQRIAHATANAPHKRNPMSDPLALFIMPTQLSRVLHCEAPPLSAIRGALITLGYHVTKSHCRPGSLKTNAPWSILWRVMRAWVQTHPIKEGSLNEGMAGYRILHKPDGKAENEDFSDIVFDEALGKENQKQKGEVNYQMNPNAYWGPMAKAGKKGLTAEELSKVGNAEKDKRRREEKERRLQNGEVGRPEEGHGGENKRKRRRNKKNEGGGEDGEEDGLFLTVDSDNDGGGEKEGMPPPPPATAAEKIDQVQRKGNANETPARSKDSEAALYGMVGISASDLQKLEEQAMMGMKKR
ncbi:hypothetical protein ABW19_dt0208243 [Dactylella cylindrospora]|nr:hypothetical protein ABW19_dt0208243 [Dactylella cylindrospora]